MLNDRGRGWVPDAPPTSEERARHLEHTAALIGAAAAPKTEGGLDRAPWVLDQLDSEACTMHAGAGWLYGLTGFRGSPWVPWWLARMDDLRATDKHPPNVGVSVSAMLRTMERHGFPTANSWGPGAPGFDAVPAYSGVPPALARIGAQQHKLDVIPIWDSGSDAVDALCAGLDARQPGGIVVKADSVFENPVDGVVGPENGEDVDSHLVAIWRYRTATDGSREALAVNSWGISYGIGGTVWLSEARIRAASFLCTARLA